ncbi:signal peptidase II [Actinomadura verrucosospora]|uniref:Lipoprotein signal peptidase n=1 Tax=Actinomadura verrucosospora TaxID=46165 RepID=A0A7D4A276_ACTVE|nr:signal peptidase II [Actinomadura verrucosospora]QKG26666.1 lipoprotein signal peptidase [Actinomadura verrucosospora]
MGPPRPRRVGVLIAVALAALAADIVSKTIVVATLQDRAPVRLLGGLLTLRETRNSGAAFSIGTGYTIVFTVIACGVVVAILRTARNLRSLPWAACLGLLLGGAIGNLIDRLFRAPAPLKGHVVDWIEFPHYPVFNLADSAIVCGGILAVVLAARGLQIDGTRLAGKDGDEEPDEPAAEPSEPSAPAAKEAAKGAPEAPAADEPAPEGAPRASDEPPGPGAGDVPAREERP